MVLIVPPTKPTRSKIRAVTRLSDTGYSGGIQQRRRVARVFIGV
jgi:alpha-D-ribose 1-methylphosphonate 5-triphosphate synthase subunit PhnL